MANDIGMNEFQKQTRKDRNRTLTRHEHLLHALHGLAVPTGKIHAVYSRPYDGGCVDYDDVRLELSSLLFHAAELADMIGTDLADIARGGIG